MINKEALEGLNKEEQINSEIKDSWLHIKDLEAELEHFLVREPNEVECIARIKKHIDDLYEGIDLLNNTQT
jgi:hypothetical protein